jgi:hypothetical protein
MKKFTINCDFGGQLAPFTIYIGKPEPGHHPLHFQADWLSKQRGGMIPGEVMEAVTQLQELAVKNGVSLEELCVYALGTEEEQAALAAETGGGETLPEETPVDDSGEQIAAEAQAEQGNEQIAEENTGDDTDDTSAKKPQE